MKDKITIAIDAMGGENSPDKNIHGLSLFLQNNKKLKNTKYHIRILLFIILCQLFQMKKRH